MMSHLLCYYVAGLLILVHGSWIMARKAFHPEIATMKALYISGTTAEELASRFSVNLSTLRSRISREKWGKQPEIRLQKIQELTEKTTQILHDIWQDRAIQIREKEFKIAEKALSHIEQMPEDQVLRQASGIDILAKMGRRSTGLDKEESNKNAVNIAVLGDIGISDSESSFYRVAKKATDQPRVTDFDHNPVQESASTE